jgi:hypothetical protein
MKRDLQKVRTWLNDRLVLTKIILVEEDDDVEIDVPIAMWVSLFEDTLREDNLNFMCRISIIVTHVVAQGKNYLD